MKTMPTTPSLPVEPGPAGVEERLADGQQPPHEHDQIEGQQRPQHLRRDDPRSEPSGRLELDEGEAERDEHQ